MSDQIKILIAEDHEQTASLLKRALENFYADKDIDVFTSPSLGSALQIARQRGPFNLAIVDFELKDSKPQQTLQSLNLFGCPVIGMSGVGSGEIRDDAYRFGVVDYVEKPIITEVLIDKSARAMERHSGHKTLASVQRRAQTELSQKLSNSVSPAPARQTSLLLKILLGGAGAAVALLSFTVGELRGSLSKAKQSGANEQANKDHFEKIDIALTLIAEGNHSRDGKIDDVIKSQHRMEINVAKLLMKNGIDPERER